MESDQFQMGRTKVFIKNPESVSNSVHGRITDAVPVGPTFITETFQI